MFDQSTNYMMPAANSFVVPSRLVHYGLFFSDSLA